MKTPTTNPKLIICFNLDFILLKGNLHNYIMDQEEKLKKVKNLKFRANGYRLALAEVRHTPDEIEEARAKIEELNKEKVSKIN